jgi:hypothetical protein
MLKLLISQFINTAIFYYFISLLFPGFMWEQSGLIPQMSNLIVISSYMAVGLGIICSLIDLIREKCCNPFKNQ